MKIQKKLPVALALFAAGLVAQPGTADERQTSAMAKAKAVALETVALPSKTLGILQINAQAEVAFRIAEGARIPAEFLGWNVIVCDSQGNPAKMASCGESLINQGADAIATVAIEPGAVMAQLRKAKERNIPWITLGGGTTPSDLISAQYAPLETEMSDLLHTYLIEQLEARESAEKTVAISTFSMVWAGKERSDDLYRDLEGTQISVVDEHVNNIADPIADGLKSTNTQLTAFPDVDALLATANYMVPIMGQVVAQKYSGKSFPERPLVVGYLDDLINLNAIRKGHADAIATMRLDAASYVGIDQLAQYFARGKALNPDGYMRGMETYGIDLREATLVTQANLPAEGSYVEPTDDFETFFKTKWKLEFGVGG